MVSVYDPNAHSVADVFSVPATNEPFGAGVQLVAVDALDVYVPAAHGEHVVPST